MQQRLRSSVHAAGLLTIFVMSGAAHAQSWQTRSSAMSLKGGESAEVGDLYYVINCRSMLTAPPTATIMTGPPGVTVEVKEQPVVPRMQQCSRPVQGAKLILKAGDVTDESETNTVVRVEYTTKDGQRQVSYNINLALFPAQ